jgi:hypothetical protein
VYVRERDGMGWNGMGCVRRVVVLHLPLFIRRDDPVIFSVNGMRLVESTGP